MDGMPSFQVGYSVKSDCHNEIKKGNVTFQFEFKSELTIKTNGYGDQRYTDSRIPDPQSQIL